MTLGTTIRLPKNDKFRIAALKSAKENRLNAGQAN